MKRQAAALSVVVAGLWVVVTAGSALAAGTDAAAGRKVFEQRKCILCHSVGSEKGAMVKVGGPLDGVGGKRDAKWLKAYLSDPKSKIPTAKMPKYKYTDQDLEALVHYMQSLK